MKFYIIKFWFGALMLSLCAAAAHAEKLSQSNMDKYIESIDALVNSENKNIKAIQAKLQQGQNVQFDVDENGNIALMSQMLKHLDAPMLDALTDIVEDSGFDSVQNWASVGDKVSAAMMAIEMRKQPMDMSQMTPEMIAMMPENMRAQIEGAMRLIKATENVPEEDITLVQANYEKLKKHMK